MKKKTNNILESVHNTIAGLYSIGVVNARTMREFDSLCLPETPVFDAKKIKTLRERENVSQPVFASFLNVSASAVKKWEAGEVHPSGAAVRLLDIIDHYGLGVIMHEAEAKSRY